MYAVLKSLTGALECGKIQDIQSRSSKETVQKPNQQMKDVVKDKVEERRRGCRLLRRNETSK